MRTAAATELVYQGGRRDRLVRRHLPALRRQQYVAAFRESGLTREAFARREGIGYTTLCTWVQKEEKASGRAVQPAALVRFAEVSLPASADGLEVRLVDGTTVRGGNAGELAALVRALRD